MSEPSLQETYAPQSVCFGCGPANDQGLRIRSFAQGDTVVADWQPQPHHHAFPGFLNGGIIGALLDCHSNWAATWRLMTRRGLAHPPCTVTAEMSVKFHRPTPMDQPLHLEAKVVEEGDNRATVETALTAQGKLCASCRAVFVAVGEHHPAFHRW